MEGGNDERKEGRKGGRKEGGVDGWNEREMNGMRGRWKEEMKNGRMKVVISEGGGRIGWKGEWIERWKGGWMERKRKE